MNNKSRILNQQIFNK